MSPGTSGEHFVSSAGAATCCGRGAARGRAGAMASAPCKRGLGALPSPDPHRAIPVGVSECGHACASLTILAAP
eukprot:scaffold31418_cov90-Isochrysis_galbana.AAC.1